MKPRLFVMVLFAGLLLSGCTAGGQKYLLAFSGASGGFPDTPQSYRAGERVTVYYDASMIATDTDYLFYLDGAPISADFERGKGFRIGFEMPDHDAELRCEEERTMEKNIGKPTVEPAVLRFSSFDGGGPLYTVSADDPDVIEWTAEYDYGSENPEEVDGAPYDVILTFTGLQTGKTQIRIEERSPIADNRDYIYAATVNDDLSVTLTLESITVPDEVWEEDMTEEAEIEWTPVLKIETGDTVFYAAFEDNDSAAALRERLEDSPITLELHDYGSFEKVGDLPWSLPRCDERITTEPGDVILYLGNEITIYYDQNTWTFTRMAKIPNVTREDLLAAFGNGNVTVQFSVDWIG